VFVLLQDDLDLIKSLNFDAYQFSISRSVQDSLGDAVDGGELLGVLAVPNASLGRTCTSRVIEAIHEL